MQGSFFHQNFFFVCALVVSFRVVNLKNVDKFSSSLKKKKSNKFSFNFFFFSRINWLLLGYQLNCFSRRFYMKERRLYIYIYIYERK